jgi:hypothetical protein
VISRRLARRATSPSANQRPDQSGRGAARLRAPASPGIAPAWSWPPPRPLIAWCAQGVHVPPRSAGRICQRPDAAPDPFPAAPAVAWGQGGAGLFPAEEPPHDDHPLHSSRPLPRGVHLRPAPAQGRVRPDPRHPPGDRPGSAHSRGWPWDHFRRSADQRCPRRQLIDPPRGILHDER